MSDMYELTNRVARVRFVVAVMLWGESVIDRATNAPAAGR
jgi:hypothetical protein